ncbi:MAG: hypothetical protein IKW67_00440 [Alphaproteobacteria bacterium]|nr:hypothetical protein [Alphaproteobacteria bacterium]
MKVGIIGAGAWGTALSIVTARGGADVIMWSFDGMYKEFDNVDMPHNIKVSTNMSDIKETDLWLIVTPAAFFRETMRKARKYYNGQPVIICTKGAEYSTNQFMSAVLQSEIPECRDLGVLAGPQFAAEVAQGIPTGSTLAGNNNIIVAGQEALNKLYINPSDDIIGTEICSVGKNAVALICGYNVGAGKGENERAMMFTRAWNEVLNIGLAAGAKMRTFLDLCGIGDLFLTATSETSRNFSAGVAIARGDTPSGTVEGIFALCGLIAHAKNLGINTPVLIEMKEKINI